MPYQHPPHVQEVFQHLLKARSNPTVKLRKSAFLRTSMTDIDGQERACHLRNYQAQAVQNLVPMPRFVLGDDTGLGKTLTAMASLCYLVDTADPKKILIITIKSAVFQWLEEFDKFCTPGAFKVRCLSSDLGPKGRVKVYKEWLKDSGRSVLVMSYSLARRDVTILGKVAPFVDVLIADEAAEFCNPASRIFQIMRMLAQQAKRMWALTATPIQNNLIDGYAIFSIVVPGLFPKSVDAFMQEYCHLQIIKPPGSPPRKVIVGYKDGKVAQFKDMIAPYFLARPKAAVAPELPPVIIIRHRIEMSSTQKALYEQALASVDEDGLEDEPDSESPKKKSKLAVLTALQQIVNHPSLVGAEGDSAKMHALFELLEEGEISREKVLVYSRFRTMIDILEAEATRRGISSVRITGSENDTERQTARHRFMDPSSGVRICFLTKAGGTGLNLQAAKAFIFFDTPWAGGGYIQFVGRMNRIGQLFDKCYAIHLTCNGSIDEITFSKLGGKLHLIDQVVGGQLVLSNVSDSMEASTIDELYEAAIRRRRS